MGALIGRKQEQLNLAEWCRSSKAELVCVYGRRRVGKTFLVDCTFQNRMAFAATGVDDKRNATQLKIFHRALKEYGCGQSAPPDDWFEAFDRLRQLLQREDVVRGDNHRRIVFLDEFPWLASKKSDFLVAFADFWNSWASKQDDVMVIVCGSATSWIIKNLFEDSGSMYNRITRRLYVAPLQLCDIEHMANMMDLGWSRDTILRAYSVFGGLPYYFDMMDRRLSLSQNIDMLCFGPHAPLRNEVPHLMEATLSGSALHRELLSALAESKKGIHRTELANIMGTNGESLKRALDDLEKCGYIRRYCNPYEKYKPSIYQMVDPFLLFAFRFMDEAPLASWADFEGSPAYYTWRGNAFEIVCLTHISQIKSALGIAAVQTTCFPWTSTGSKPGAQIDLVIERKDSTTDLCEMKYTDEPLTVSGDLIDALRRKRSVFKDESGTRNTLHNVLVSASGLAGGYLPDGVSAVVTGDDLFGR